MDTLSVGQSYALSLLNAWLDCVVCSIEFRQNAMSGDKSRESKAKAQEYVARLTRLWLELEPKISGRTATDHAEFNQKFMAMQDYYYHPDKLLEGNTEEIYKLEEVIREALEKQQITVYEG